MKSKTKISKNKNKNDAKLRMSLHEKDKRKSKSRSRSKASLENSASPLKRDENGRNSIKKTKNKVVNKKMDASKSQSNSKSKSKSPKKFLKNQNVKNFELIDELSKVNSVSFKENMNFIIPLLKKDSNQ